MTQLIEETHPLEPFLPANAKILMLGTFPPARNKWSMDFYYPNLQNDMWRIFGIVFFGDKEHFMEPDASGKKFFYKDRITSFLEEKGIALSDTARKVVRLKGDASDKFLQITETVDLGYLLSRLPACTAIVTTGEKATDELSSVTGTLLKRIGSSEKFEFKGRNLKHYRMPSSSRAYPLKIEEKAQYYSTMFNELGLT